MKIISTSSSKIHGWLFFLLLMTIVGCSEKTATSSASPVAKAISDSEGKIPVTIGLNWFAEAEHGGYYAALVHGYFADEGLNVTIRTGGPKVPVIPDAADGRVDFAVDNADKLLLARQQQADVLAVMAPIQNSPRCIMVHQKLGLNRLEDLARQKKFTLAMNSGQPFAQFLKKKLDLENIQIVQYGGSIAPFLDNVEYGQQAYSFSEPFVATSKQSDPQCLMLSDIGFNTYTSVLITRREMIDKQSDIVAKVTRASIRGWRKYLSDDAESNKIIQAQNPEMGQETLNFGVKILKPLCLPEGFEESRIGEMTSDRWQTLVSQMTEIGLVKTDRVKAEDAFSLRFLNQNSR